jgi:NADPH2:quinone reductase
MQSVIFRQPGGPEVLELVDAPAPTPGPGQVVIRAQAMAVSKPDVLIRKGIYTWSPPLPANPGNELAGVVESVGAGVTDFRPGQRALLSARELSVRGGCYAELIAVPAAAVHPLPDSVELEQAVVLPTYLVAYAMLKELDIARHARTIYVSGAAGGMGSAIADLARSLDIEVIGSVSSEAKAAYARRQGTTHAIYYKTEPLLERVMALTHGRGVDASFDHVIGPGFLDCIRMLADFGTAVAYNVFSPMPDQDVFGEMRKLSKRSPGLRVFNVHTYDKDQPALHRIMGELIELLAQQKINPNVGARFPLSDVAQAHRVFESGEVLGKVVLTT